MPLPYYCDCIVYIIAPELTHLLLLSRLRHRQSLQVAPQVNIWMEPSITEKAKAILP